MNRGAWVRARKNDAGVTVGEEGLYVGAHEASGIPLVLIEGRRAALLDTQLEVVEDGPEEESVAGICKAEGCERSALAKELCSVHYYQERRRLKELKDREAKEAAEADAEAERGPAPADPEPEPQPVRYVPMDPEPAEEPEPEPVAAAGPVWVAPTVEPEPETDDDPDPFAPFVDPTGTTAVGVLFEAAHVIRRGVGQLVTTGGSVDELHRLIEAVSELEETAKEMRQDKAA